MPAQFAWFFLSFRGRISRQEFWLGYALTIAVMLLLMPQLWDNSRKAVGAYLLWVIASAMVLWPLLTLHVKRLHDLNVSGWWLVCFCAAVAALNASGIIQTDNASVAMVGAIGLMRGQRGDNRFGPDPIATGS